jgi:hypothetical protein
MCKQLILLAMAVTIATVLPSRSRAEEVPVEYREAIAKGLEWMARNQSKDGHWEAFGSQFPVTMTALGGMSLLMEGSTIREGKYRDNIRRAVDWLMARSMPNGLIGNPNNPSESTRYMYGHGFAMLFLSSVVGEEEDPDRRRKLVDILERAVDFTTDAQTDRGGWGYVSAKDGGGFDEGSVTITQVQGLRAARNAGISFDIVKGGAVKRNGEVIKRAIKYLSDSTNPRGGVIYSLAMMQGGGEGRPALTAAAISCGFSAGEHDSPLVKKWFRFCQENLRSSYGDTRIGNHDEYTYYYYAQAIYMLGDDGWARLFPDSKEQGLKWSTFRKASFDGIVRSQASDGSWSGGQVGPVFITAVHLSILQLDKAALPIYQR